MRLFFSFIFLLGIITSFILFGKQDSRLQSLFGNTFETFLALPSEAACPGFCGRSCHAPYIYDYADTGSCRSTSSYTQYCCIRTCRVTTTCTWAAPPNTCNTNNDVETCVRRNSDCSTTTWVRARRTINNCGGPGVCRGGRCIPWCSTGNRYGACDNIGTNTTCPPPGNNAFETCTYTTAPGWGGNCVQRACPDRRCSLNTCTTPTWGCYAPRCQPHFTISGTIRDVDNNGPTNIRVDAAGHSASGGNYLFPYTDSIRAGTYTVAEALPVDYIAIGPSSRRVTVGPRFGQNATNVNFTVAKIFTISGRVTDPYNGNAGVGGVTITANGSSTTTAPNGTYTIGYPARIRRGTYTVTMTILPGYTNTTTLSVRATVGGNTNATGIDFGTTKMFSISGDAFVDPNIDGIQQPGEPTYTTTPSNFAYNATTLPISQFQPSPASPFVSNNGTYSISQLISGTTTVSFALPFPPPVWYMTSPLNGPPANFSVTVGYNCNVNGAPGATCTAGNITNLNFGMDDNVPWIQSVCGDMRSDPGFNNQEPAGQSAITTDPAICSDPGIVFSGNSNANFGDGQASSSQQVVGDTAYPETFDAKTFSSYDYLANKVLSSGVSETNLASPSICPDLTNCSLPVNLTHGIYFANSSVTLNTFTFPTPPPNQHFNYIFLINGDLTINGNIIVPPGDSVLFAVSGNIFVNPSVGTPPTSNAPNLEGIFTTDKSFIIDSNVIRCTDLRLNIQGTIIVNALQQAGGGSLQNNRNLCRFNAVAPTLQITQRIDFLLNLPEFLRTKGITSQEVAP